MGESDLTCTHMVIHVILCNLVSYDHLCILSVGLGVCMYFGTLGDSFRENITICY